MAKISIHLVKVELPTDVVTGIREELEARGLPKEALFIGPVDDHPGKLSLMWMVGDKPILMTAPFWRFRTARSAGLVAAEFAAVVAAATPQKPPAEHTGLG